MFKDAIEDAIVLVIRLKIFAVSYIRKNFVWNVLQSTGDYKTMYQTLTANVAS